jgi:hypothetical protein
VAKFGVQFERPYIFFYKANIFLSSFFMMGMENAMHARMTIPAMLVFFIS